MIARSCAGCRGRRFWQYTCRQTKGGRGNATRLAIVLLCWSALQSLGCQPMLDQAARYVLPREGVRPAKFAVHTQRRGGFTTADGVTLRADVHRPIGLVKAPTLLVRIPFTNTLKNRVRSDAVARYWASRGYVVVIQGTRGRYESGGRFYPLRHERQDGIETLHWLARQPWYDGRVGMWGGSAFGHTQWAVADQDSVGVGAFFIQIASSSFRTMFFPGGAFSLESAMYWAIRSRGQRDRTVEIEDLRRGVEGLPLIDADEAAIGDTDFYNDWLLHRETDKYWDKIDGHDRAKTLAAPALLLAGWFDPFLPSQLADFTAIKRDALPHIAGETRLIIGPWGHAFSPRLPGQDNDNPYRLASIAPALPWFDYHLGVHGDSLNMAPVRLFVMGINRWRNEREWPLRRTQYTPYYIDSAGDAHRPAGSGRLTLGLPVGAGTPDAFVYNPLQPVPSAGGAMLGPRAGVYIQNEIEERSDVLVYSSQALEEPLETTGPITAVLYVKTDVVSTDWTVKLVDVHPDSTAYNVCDGILRHSYALERMPQPIKVVLWPTSHVFLTGHRIRVEISSSNFPRYDRNLNSGDTGVDATVSHIAHQHIYHTPRYPSHIVLPIIPAISNR